MGVVKIFAVWLTIQFVLKGHTYKTRSTIKSYNYMQHQCHYIPTPTRLVASVGDYTDPHLYKIQLCRLSTVQPQNSEACCAHTMHTPTVNKSRCGRLYVTCIKSRCGGQHQCQYIPTPAILDQQVPLWGTIYATPMPTHLQDSIIKSGLYM